MTGEMLVLRGIRKAFGAKAVLQDFNLTLPLQGTVALMGPSGCGKTTLLRLLAGLERPDAGEMRLPPGARISMVFQEDRLLQGISAWENITAVLPRERRQLADLCLRGCGLEAAKNLYPGQMSGGMKRRLAIARAVAFGGELLLLDEPFSGLDDGTRNQVAQFLFRRQEPLLPRPSLTLWVTHGEDEALAWADKTLRLSGPPLVWD